MTNPHTPCGPVPRDDHDAPAWDSMGKAGWPLRLILWLSAFVFLGKFVWEVVK